VKTVLPHNTNTIEESATPSYRPRLSRETRRLLLTAGLAVLTLWVLARMRFPDRPPTPNPVPPILDQLTGTPTFAVLAARVAELRDELVDSLVPVVFVRDDARDDTTRPMPRATALRIRDDLAVAVVAPTMRRGGAAPFGVVADDAGSGLMLVETPNRTRPRLPLFWSPRDLDQPRYVLASSTTASDISLHPVFIGSLTAIDTPQWPGPIWALPFDAAITPGALLFTEDGELLGVVAPYDAGLAVVPARMLLASAERLLETPQKPPADLGVEVDTLTPRLATAAGAEAGVVVAWVDPRGIAAAMLRVGDVIQMVDDLRITTVEQWRVRAARIGIGDSVALRVVRRGAQRSVQLSVPRPPEANGATLGLVMRAAVQVGAEVTRVAAGSAANAAGIMPGDFITAIGNANAPTPAQIGSAFASLDRGDLLLVALRRNGAHRVVVLQR
jgi:hypothetical protein